MKKIIITLVATLIAALSVQTLNAQDVSGQVLYQDDPNRPISNVIVSLKNIDNNSFQTVTTGGNGYYEFFNVPNGNYILTGTTSNPPGGVTVLDAVLVAQYLQGQIAFNDIQLLAADVNGSGNVTWGDHQLILNHIRKGTGFPIGPWTFMTETFTISNFKEGIPHGLGGTCSGDVGGTFVPTVNNTPALPIAQEGLLNVSSEQNFSAEIQIKNDLTIKAAGIIIDYPSELLQIESIDFKGSDYDYDIENGQIRIVWCHPNATSINFNTGEAFITIHGVTSSAFKNGMAVNFSLNGNSSLINTSNEEVNNLKFSSPVIKYGNPSMKLSNYPNPFTTSTKLSIYNASEGNASVELYSASGQLVKNISIGKLNAGYQEVSLEASELTKGYYVCKLRVQTSNGELTQTIRIMKAD